MASRLRRKRDFRYRLLFEAGAEGLVLAGGGRILDANPEACRILLLRTREGITSAGLGAFFDATDPRLETAREEQRRAGRFRGKLRLLRGDGTAFPAEVSVACKRDESGEEHLGIAFRDITGRERIETALRESEECFRLTFELAPVGMAHVGPDGRWLRINDKLLEIVGYSREELLSLTFQDITHPENLDADLRYVDQLLSGRVPTYSMEKRYIKKDRSRVWIELTVSLMRDSSGEPEYFISIIEDITERKLAELVPKPLSPRELEVLGVVAQGKTNRQIARDLAYSVATVKLDVRRATAKLGGPDRHKAAWLTFAFVVCSVIMLVVYAERAEAAMVTQTSRPAGSGICLQETSALLFRPELGNQWVATATTKVFDYSTCRSPISKPAGYIASRIDVWYFDQNGLWKRCANSGWVYNRATSSSQLAVKYLGVNGCRDNSAHYAYAYGAVYSNGQWRELRNVSSGRQVTYCMIKRHFRRGIDARSEDIRRPNILARPTRGR